MISAHFQDKPFNITLIQVFAATTNTEEAEAEQFFEYLQNLLELTAQGHFHHRTLECKSKKSTATWSNSQVWPWSTK